MRLLEADKELNRRFHDLPDAERIGFLTQGFEQAVAPQNGDSVVQDFDLPAIDAETLTTGTLDDQIRGAMDKLNFLAARFVMLEGHTYDDIIKTLALRQWGYKLLLGNTDDTQNVQLVADFFAKTGKSEYIKPVFARMAEHAVEYEHLTESIIDHPLFQQVVGEQPTRQYKFRAQLHELLEHRDYIKEQAAGALLDGGYNLKEFNFNRWYAQEKDWDLRFRKKQYKESKKEEAWLETFIAGHAVGKTPATAVIKRPRKGKAPASLKSEIEDLDAAIQGELTKGKKADYLARVMAPLVSDHRQLEIDTSNTVQMKIWEHIWGGNFMQLAYEIRRATEMSEVYGGMQYVQWALYQPEHTATMNPILLQDAYAMVICSKLVLGHMESAKELYSAPALQAFRNEEKVKAAINLAWKVLLDPMIDEPREDYQPPHGYLVGLAVEFGKYLDGNKLAKPYLKLLQPGAKLGKRENSILEDVTNLAVLKQVYTNQGREHELKQCFLQVFDATFDAATAHPGLFVHPAWITSVLQDPIFREYVTETEARERLKQSVDKMLVRKDADEPERAAFGVKHGVLTLSQDPGLRPYLEGMVDIPRLVEGLIDDVIGPWKLRYMTEPLSLRHQGEVVGDSRRDVETYMIADKVRTHIQPEKMQNLVAYLLGICADLTVSENAAVSTMYIYRDAKRADPNYQKPDYFPDFESGREKASVALLNNIYLREKALGTDLARAATMMTNIVFRGTYVQPGRFYPHIDAMMDLLDTKAAELLPKEGLGADAIREYRILYGFLRGTNDGMGKNAPTA